MTDVAAWNAYINANNQEPQTGTQFQRWVAHSSHRYDISYSKAYTIYDTYTGKGKVEIEHNKSNVQQSHMSHKSHPQNNNEPLSPKQQPKSCPTNSRPKYVYNTQQNQNSRKQNTVQFRNNNNPIQNQNVRSRTRSEYTNPNQNNRKQNSIQFVNITNQKQKQNYNYNNGHNGYIKSKTPQTQYQNARTRAHTEYNNSYANANKTNNKMNKLDNKILDNKATIRRRSNTMPNGPNNLPPNLLINIDHSAIKKTKHIKVYSLSPKQAKSIIPKNDLTLFLIHYDIRDLKRKLIENKIALMHLKTIEIGDLTEFCADLKLSVPEKIRFKHAVKELQKGAVEYKNGNNKNSNNNIEEQKQNEFGLTQSEAIKYSHSPAKAACDDDYDEKLNEYFGNKHQHAGTVVIKNDLNIYNNNQMRNGNVMQKQYMQKN